MATSEAHKKAQTRVQELLAKHYNLTSIEAFQPTPNEKYLYSMEDGADEFIVKPYLLDVLATNPRDQCLIKHVIIGVEIDGKKGHKTSKQQTTRDRQRTDSLQETYPNMKIFRFDTKDLIGRGYVHPKTKTRKPILSDEDILKELGIKCTHD
jgi:hypothetical protein